MGRKFLKNILAVLVGALVLFAGIFALVQLFKNRTSESAQQSPEIITTNFIGYDLTRATTGNTSNIKMLLQPGAEAHDFEPTPQDIINIKNTKLFIYTGGESDTWVKNLLKNSEIPEENTLRLMDLVELREEETVSGMEEEAESEEAEDAEEYDEHIWTSPVNAAKLLEAIRDRLIKLNPENTDTYQENSAKYLSKLNNLDAEFRNLISASSRRELIFADRFPFLYFVKEYDLSYFAAFPGCSDQTEASSKTIAFLIDKVKADKIPAVLKIELTSDKLARSIADATGAKVLTMNATHNISAEDFKNGLTYAEILEQNLSVLREALN